MSTYTHLVDCDVDPEDETVLVITDRSGEPLWRLHRSGRLEPLWTPPLRPRRERTEAPCR
jgi:hypothetical protein